MSCSSDVAVDCLGQLARQAPTSLAVLRDPDLMMSWEPLKREVLSVTSPNYFTIINCKQYPNFRDVKNKPVSEN